MKKILGFLLPIGGLIAAGFGLIYLKRKQLLSQGQGTIPNGTIRTVKPTTKTQNELLGPIKCPYCSATFNRDTGIEAFNKHVREAHDATPPIVVKQR